MTPGRSTPPILELIAEHEAAATTAPDQLRAQIATLTAQLTTLETELTDLAVTRSTLIRLTGQTAPGAPADATVTSPAYQQILAVFATATSGLHAKDVCRALGTGVTAKHTEALRARLKRLVAHHVLAEPEPGLFVLAPTTASAANPPRQDP